MCELSIIVPVYNVEKYLPACIDSILRNKTSRIELILIDDGSTDNSGKICDDYARQDARVCVIRQTNSGVSIARNNGLLRARGTWLTFVDSDDLLTDSAVDVMLAHTSDSADFLVYGFEYYQEGQPASTAQVDWQEMRLSSPEELALYRRALLFREQEPEARLRDVPIPSMWSKMIRTSFVLQHDLHFIPRLKMGEDRHFWLQCSLCAKEICLVPRIVYRYRRNEGSITVRFVPDIIDIKNRMYHAFDELLCATEDMRIRRQYCLFHVQHVVGCLESGAYHPDCHWNRQQRIQWLKDLRGQFWVKRMDAGLADEYSNYCFKIYKLFVSFDTTEASYAALDRQLLWQLCIKKRLLRNSLIRHINQYRKSFARSAAAPAGKDI